MLFDKLIYNDSYNQSLSYFLLDMGFTLILFLFMILKCYLFFVYIFFNLIDKALYLLCILKCTFGQEFENTFF